MSKRQKAETDLVKRIEALEEAQKIDHGFLEQIRALNSQRAELIVVVKLLHQKNTLLRQGIETLKMQRLTTGQHLFLDKTLEEEAAINAKCYIKENKDELEKRT